jgi:hypothetical protein
VSLAVAEPRREVLDVHVADLERPAQRDDALATGVKDLFALGAAALAGPESRVAGARTGLEEAHVLAPRRSRGAAGTTVDAGRRHRVDEEPVERAIAPGHGRPASLVEIFHVVQVRGRLGARTFQ